MPVPTVPSLRCPICRADAVRRAVDSELNKPGTVRRRRRQCGACGRRWTTYEQIAKRLRRQCQHRRVRTIRTCRDCQVTL